MGSESHLRSVCEGGLKRGLSGCQSLLNVACFPRAPSFPKLPLEPGRAGEGSRSQTKPSHQGRLGLRALRRSTHFSPYQEPCPSSREAQCGWSLRATRSDATLSSPHLRPSDYSGSGGGGVSGPNLQLSYKHPRGGSWKVWAGAYMFSPPHIPSLR